jgi:hypothetical protein
MGMVLLMIVVGRDLRGDWIDWVNFKAVGDFIVLAWGVCGM